jgi:aryl-alcohol dehydrogenase-like predicted oxidoreductase
MNIIRKKEIGLGCRWLKNGGFEVLKAAHLAGILYIDTAAGYSESERIIGEYLRDSDWKPAISTKIWAFDEVKIRAGLEKSLKLLGVEQIDIYLIHNPEDNEQALPVFHKIKNEGLVKSIGICGWHGDEAKILKYIDDVDVIQIALTPFHRGMVEKGVIKAAAEKNITVQIMSPLAKGLITGKHPVLRLLEPYGIATLEQASLCYLLDNVPNVIPIPGTSKPERVKEFAKVVEMPTVPAEVWEQFVHEAKEYPELLKLP